MAEGNGKKRTLRVDQVADALDCSRSLVYELADAGELKAFRVGLGEKRGGLRVLSDSLEAFIARRCLEFESECAVVEILSTVSTVSTGHLSGQKKSDKLRP
jgi:excisionase family DNA binding protein